MSDRARELDLSSVPTGSLVSGRWTDGPDRFAVLDKFTDRPVAWVSSARREEVREAVAKGSAGVRDAALPPARRAKILDRCAELVEEHRPTLVPLMMVEAGFTRTDAMTEVDRSVSTLRICAQESTRISGEMVPFGATAGAERRLGFTVRRPLGVVCAITPFNSPLNVVLHKVGPALAAGNAVVLKPSPLAPLSSGLLCRLFLEAGLPEALLSLLHGEGSTVGEWLLAEPEVDFYAFTGSTTVGRAIAAGAGLRRTQLELGSIASTIVCADADLEIAVAKVSNAAFRKAGQVCTSTQLLYVQSGVLGEVTGALAAAAGALLAGDPFVPDTRVGPMISPAAVDRIDAWVDEAIAGGATSVAGGARTVTTFAPTILVDVPAGARVVEQEVFAPVVSIIPFDHVQEAVRGANSTPFGLSCGFFSRNTDAVRMAMESLRFGAIHVNEASSARADEMPFGGVKDSGHGQEGPRYAIRELTEERLVTWNP